MRPAFTQPAVAQRTGSGTLVLQPFLPEPLPHARMPVSLTPAAVDRARQYIAQQPGGAGLRFGVRKNGCSGFAYVIDVAASPGQGDTVVEAGGVSVFIDASSLPHVDGTEIDFVRRGLNQEFVFRNPQATGECGCGESFTTRDDLPV